MRDLDTGRCDLCGSEDGERTRDPVFGMVAWVCGPCQREHAEESVFGTPDMTVPEGETDADWFESRQIDLDERVDPRSL